MGPATDRGIRPSPRWQALLAGSEAGALGAVISDIARALEDRSQEVSEPSLCDGQTGVALFFSFLYKVSRESRHAATAERMVAAAMDSLPDHSHDLGLFSGLSGVALGLRQALTHIGSNPASDLTADIDEIVIEALRPSPWTWEYDLARGLVGLGCYALSHPDPDYSTTVLDLVLSRLEELAVPQAVGVAWWTPPELMEEARRALFPEGAFDLGLAHGVCGVIAFLARVVSLPPCDRGERAGSLLRRALEWLLSQRRSAGDGAAYATPGSAFTSFALPGAASGAGPSIRSGWCYGDPGAAWALLSAAEATRDGNLRRAAIEVALRDCSRPREEKGVRDAALCHGAAGLGHLYNRFFQATGRRELAAAARGWFDGALSMRRDGVGVGGFMSWWDDGTGWRATPGYISGAAGIGLALLAASSSEPPDWDRALLLSPGLARG
jgi:lantibiotic modifying enzyme